MTETLLKYLFFFILGVIGLFSIYTLVVYMPVNMYAQAKCLKSGYPEYRVTVGLESYCLNLDGSVTVKVDKLETLGK